MLAISDCFVIVNAAGLYWNGRKWLADVNRAKRWSTGPDPWQEADSQCQRLRIRGTACAIVYCPPLSSSTHSAGKGASLPVA